MSRSPRRRRPPAQRVMRRGKTRRDRESGAWHNHRDNKGLRRLDRKAT